MEESKVTFIPKLTSRTATGFYCLSCACSRSGLLCSVLSRPRSSGQGSSGGITFHPSNAFLACNFEIRAFYLGYLPQKAGFRNYSKSIWVCCHSLSTPQVGSHHFWWGRCQKTLKLSFGNFRVFWADLHFE
jgi:hypothetical protein